MLNLSFECTRLERNYSSCTGRIGEGSVKIYVAAAEALRKRRKTG
jgi:hypothetical protein